MVMQSRVEKPLISLCIPTNGVIEWMFPVLDSIYEQKVDEELFEVVVTDNGDNSEFNRLMTEYCGKHKNITYEKTNALPFLNEIESYKRARGKFIKFLNHRTKIMVGGLEKFVKFVYDNIDKKPVVYFANGVLEKSKKVFVYKTFDEFVGNLSYWSSWSTGMGFWKEDFEKIPKETVFNELFPHTTILFRERSRENYIIDNRVLLDEIPTGTIPKGRYDVFYAFAVEYPGIILELVRCGDISTETFLKVKEDNLGFISELYFDYVIKKMPCSYDLSGYKKSIGIFYRHADVKKSKIKLVMRKIGGKLRW